MWTLVVNFVCKWWRILAITLLQRPGRIVPRWPSLVTFSGSYPSASTSQLTGHVKHAASADPGDRGADAARKVPIFSLQVLMRFIGTNKRRNINTWDEDCQRVSKVTVQSTSCEQASVLPRGCVQHVDCEMYTCKGETLLPIPVRPLKYMLSLSELVSRTTTITCKHFSKTFVNKHLCFSI